MSSKQPRAEGLWGGPAEQAVLPLERWEKGPASGEHQCQAPCYVSHSYLNLVTKVEVRYSLHFIDEGTESQKAT